MHCLLFFEFIGTTELLVVLLAALLVFGPRKLPEVGRSLGRALNQVRAASDDLKRAWEVETSADAEGRDPNTHRALVARAGDAPEAEPTRRPSHAA